MSVTKFLNPTSLTYLGSKKHSNNIYTFSFKPITPINWLAGQHAMLQLYPNNGKVQRRMFSVSSAPAEKTIDITTRVSSEQASKYKQMLRALNVGDSAKLRGPVGSMYVKQPNQNNVFIACGIGITPFRAMIANYALTGQNLCGKLFYISARPHGFIFEQDLKEFSKKLSNFEIDFRTTNLSDEDLRGANQGLESTVFYIAGSPQSIKKYKQLLKSVGVKRSKIKNDPFYGYK